MFVSTFKPGHLAKFFEQIPAGEKFIFSEEVVQVMRAFERVSKSIWELKNKLNAYYDQRPFYLEFDHNIKENALVLETDNLKMFFYYDKPQKGEHMKQKGFHVAFLR